MIDIRPIFSALNIELIALLKSLKPSDWNRKTGYSNFTIKDIAAQLLGPIPISTNETPFIEIIEKYQAELLVSENESDDVKEYSKNWLFQQQIRFALNNQKLLNKEFYHPYLSIVMQALPLTYSSVNATIGTKVKVEIVGDAGGAWAIIKNEFNWSFIAPESSNPDALIYIDQQIAWLLFSKGINVMDAVQYYQLHGNTELASYALKCSQ